MFLEHLEGSNWCGVALSVSTETCCSGGVMFSFQEGATRVVGVQGTCLLEIITIIRKYLDLNVSSTMVFLTRKWPYIKGQFQLLCSDCSITSSTFPAISVPIIPTTPGAQVPAILNGESPLATWLFLLPTRVQANHIECQQKSKAALTVHCLRTSLHHRKYTTGRFLFCPFQ